MPAQPAMRALPVLSVWARVASAKAAPRLLPYGSWVFDPPRLGLPGRFARPCTPSSSPAGYGRASRSRQGEAPGRPQPRSSVRASQLEPRSFGFDHRRSIARGTSAEFFSEMSHIDQTAMKSSTGRGNARIYCCPQRVIYGQANTCQICSDARSS